MTQQRIVDVVRGKSDISQASSDIISDVAPLVITKTMKFVSSIAQTCQEVIPLLFLTNGYLIRSSHVVVHLKAN